MVNYYQEKEGEHNETIFSGILSFLVIISILTSVVYAADLKPSSKVKLKYEVTINDISSGIINVKLNISNLSGNYFEIAESWGNGLGYNSYIDTIKVSDKKGNKLSYTSKQHNFGNGNRQKVWNIDLKSNKEIVIEYARSKNVFKKMGESNGVWGFMGEDYAALLVALFS